MRISDKYYLLLTVLCGFVLSGCVVRTYTVTKDRPDQNLESGNKGYLAGAQPAGEKKERKLTRTINVMEVEFHSPIKFEKKTKRKPVKKGAAEILPEEMVEVSAGNRGYIVESEMPAIIEPAETVIEKYTVQKDDTLQKISEKFYGTTKKWNEIYKANRNILKNPDTLSVGQVLSIPVESSVRVKSEQKPEPVKENLK